MMDGMKLIFGCMIFLLTAFVLSGCGEVSESPSDLNRLKILYLYPRDGEVGVPQPMSAIVVFNDSVNFALEKANVNGGTFYLEDEEGSRVGVFTVEKSEIDHQEATFLITLGDHLLQPDTTYYVVVEGTIEGKNTDPLGTQVRNKFTVQQ